MESILELGGGINRQMLIVVLSALMVLILVSYFTYWISRHKGLKKSYFEEHWRKIMKNAKKTDMWHQVIIDADKLLDEALKRRRFKGKTMGERLLVACKELRDEDAVWWAHKLRNRIVHEPDVVVRGKDMKRALRGYNKALRDLGAL